MRILHLDSGREMRGGQWQALRLHQKLIGGGYDSLLLAREASPLMDAARNLRLPCAPLTPLALPRLSGKYDLVHAHDSRSHTLAAVLARAPFVVSRRVAFPVKTSLSSRWKYSRPHLYLAVSLYVGQELEKAGVPASRIAVVYDGVPVPTEPAKGKAILVPYTLDPAKGMALAEEAANLAGISIEISRNLEADLPRARALVYLTRSEGLGSGILLAMAHGVAVIASNVGGIPELIEDGRNGILVANEAHAVASAFNRVEPALGEAARKTVLARFTEDHMVQATLACYRKALGVD